jgi:glycine reductase
MRIVHYINQFFGQVGAESAADYPLEVRESVVGPGMMFESEIAPDAEIVATIICGDNYFVENMDIVNEEIAKILKKYRADFVIAGPAFNAGRYGVACGNVCKVANQNFGIEAITGMYYDNPGVSMYRRYAYIIPTADSARGMKDAIIKMSEFVKRLASGEEIDNPETDGYIQRGIRKSIFSQHTGAQRCVNMMLDKVNGRPFTTELPMPKFEKVNPSPGIKDISKAKIAVMTTGGLVPKGNPDAIEAGFATKYRKYSFDDFGGLRIPNVETIHGGYDPIYVNEDGNRVLPIDALVELEGEGAFGQLYNYFFVTTGNAMSTDTASGFGDEIAKQFIEANVDGVILTST